MDWNNLLTSFEGRIGRGKFWTGVIAIAIVAIIVQLLLLKIGGLLVASIVALVFLYPFYAVAIKRANDRDRPAWMVQGLIAVSALNNLATAFIGINPDGSRPPLLLLTTVLAGLAGLWALVDLGCLRGTVGPNRHGPDPLESPQPA
jgi:uncharacterized membrane protein YhaH (DUF805 family)